MPFDFMKKLTGQKEKVAADADTKADKSALRGKDFKAQTEALKPPAEDTKKKGPVAQIKSALGLGKDEKDEKAKPDKVPAKAKAKKGAPDPAAIKMAAEVLGQAQNAAGIAANIAKRVPQMLAEIAEGGLTDYFKEAVARAGTLSGWSSAIMSSTKHLEDAFDKYLEDGNLQAFLMQADAVLNEVLALRIELSGLAGPGDSISMAGLIMNPGVVQEDLVGGVKVGAKDAAKGVVPKGKAGPKEAVGGGRVLPTALNSFSGEAIRAQGPQYMQYADGLRAAIQALR